MRPIRTPAVVSTAVCETAPAVYTAVICNCFIHRFRKWSRVRAPPRSGLRFRRGNIVPTRRRNPYLPRYRAAFAFSQFRYPHRHRSALRLHFPKGAMRTYPVPLREHDRLGLRYTPAACYVHDQGTSSLGTHCKESAKHLPLPETYDAYANSHMLAMLSTLAPGRLDASSCTIASRFRCRSCDRGIHCRRVP
jgi:hypothetical protein